MLTEDNNNATYQIQSYTENSIIINKISYQKNLIISPNRLLSPWFEGHQKIPSTENLRLLLDFQPEIILIGTGQKNILLSDELLQVLTHLRCGVECMSTPAACRTYTALSSEGRQVVAGLI